MKHFFYHSIFLTMAAFIGAAASVQAQATPKTPPAPPTPDSSYRTSIAAMGEPVVFAYQSEPALQKKVRLDIKGKTAAEVFKKIADAAEVELVVDPGATSDRKYTVQADGFTVQSALNGIANFEGVRWRYQDINGKKQIRISRGSVPGSATSIFTTEGNTYASQIDAAVQDRMRLAQKALNGSRSLTYMFSAQLPNTRVKIDVRDGDVRDVLKDILTQANLPYALEDDVPTGQKRSFTFENVPVSMALDIITTSIGIGWSAESQRTATRTGAGSAPVAPLVRVGKKYMGRGQLLRSFSPATTLNITTTTTREESAPVAPAAPIPPATP